MITSNKTTALPSLLLAYSQEDFVVKGLTEILDGYAIGGDISKSESVHFLKKASVGK